MVGLVLAALKVPRRAVRILVLTVRSTTARRQATPPCWPRARPLPVRTKRRGGLRTWSEWSRVPDPSVNSRETAVEISTRTSGYAVGLIGVYAAA